MYFNRATSGNTPGCTQQTSQLLRTHYARCTNKRISVRTCLIIPFVIKVGVTTVFLLSFPVVWLSFSPKGEVHCTSIRPHPSAVFVDVTESDPGASLTVVEVLDQASYKLLFFQTVDRHQVGSHWHTVELCISPGHRCGDVLVAAAVEAGPERGTVTSLSLLYRRRGAQSQTNQEEEHEHDDVSLSQEQSWSSPVGGIEILQEGMLSLDVLMKKKSPPDTSSLL